MPANHKSPQINIHIRLNICLTSSGIVCVNNVDMTLDINKYVQEYERNHPPRPSHIPEDPNRKWWFKRDDELTQCVERCNYSLLQVALNEAGMSSVSEPINDLQRIIHARFAAMQPECVNACKQLRS